MYEVSNGTFNLNDDFTTATNKFNSGTVLIDATQNNSASGHNSDTQFAYNGVFDVTGNGTLDSVLDNNSLNLGSAIAGDFSVNLSLDSLGLPSNGSSIKSGTGNSAFNVPGVPIPAAGWLFGSALLGLAGYTKRKAA